MAVSTDNNLSVKKSNKRSKYKHLVIEIEETVSP